MKIVYAPETWDVTDGHRIFLAGPTPRSQSIASWRPNALKIFETLDYEGTILVPEDRSGLFKCSYDAQIEWEDFGLRNADCIMFWVPRSLPDMPAFTTNDEWGTWKRSGKCVWGNPPTAEKVSYQRFYAQKLNVPMSDTLEQTCVNAIETAKNHFIKRIQMEHGVYI